MYVADEWAASTCLVCDASISGTVFCSERCSMIDADQFASISASNLGLLQQAWPTLKHTMSHSRHYSEDDFGHDRPGFFERGVLGSDYSTSESSLSQWSGVFDPPTVGSFPQELADAELQRSGHLDSPQSRPSSMDDTITTQKDGNWSGIAKRMEPRRTPQPVLLRQTVPCGIRGFSTDDGSNEVGWTIWRTQGTSRYKVDDFDIASRQNSM